MNNYKLITISRYLSLFMIFIDYFININLSSSYSFFLILIFIINNQIRYFNLYDKKIFIHISLIIEFILIYILSNYIDKINVFFFIPMILDITNSKKIYNKYIYLIIAIIFSLIINIDYSLLSAFEYSFFLLVISILCIYIHNESLSKLNSQKIYNQLRISEDKLKKANSDLEIYIDSLEELTILKERNRISREIHDSVGHALSTTIIQLSAIEKLVSYDKDLKELVCELREFVKMSLKEVRNAINTLKPKEYEKYENLFKIKELINNFSKMTNIDVKMTVSKNTWKLSSIQLTSLYRVIQEALSNCIKHSNATKIQIFLNFNNDNLVINIKDNGTTCKNIIKGNGLKSITERMNELNGLARFNSSNDGFLIHASFPKNTRGEFIE
ncbi:sensor histidine kinase [Romboutsia sp. 1001713B170207_170306_H8]|uniref:sensor histidine kinase n=2 Tax=unclassified Romboutsia TaxID=2626894 RepID=UPI000820E067|nr:sensor histidine kinase [Romboutsia sp. 1001713B170207_170306_H8]SCH16053.1 Sensor histidine kinase desK [uncultured Clostridium sp.]